MSLILEKHFVIFAYFPAPLRVLEQLLNCSLLKYWLHWAFMNQE